MVRTRMKDRKKHILKRCEESYGEEGDEMGQIFIKHSSSLLAASRHEKEKLAGEK